MMTISISLQVINASAQARYLVHPRRRSPSRQIKLILITSKGLDPHPFRLREGFLYTLDDTRDYHRSCLMFNRSRSQPIGCCFGFLIQSNRSKAMKKKTSTQTSESILFQLTVSRLRQVPPLPRQTSSLEKPRASTPRPKLEELELQNQNNHRGRKRCACVSCSLQPVLSLAPPFSPSFFPSSPFFLFLQIY